MKKLTLTFIDYIKLSCILIIGATNSITLAIVFNKLFNNNTASLFSIIIIALITIFIILLVLNNKLRKLRKDNDKINSEQK